MKTNFFKRAFLCLLLIFLVLSSSVVFATDNNEVTTTKAPEPRTVEDEQTGVSAISATPDSNNTYSSDLFLYNTNVELSNTVDGNVAIYAQNANITGVVQGDVLVVANSITISEDAMIYGNLFALAPNLKIAGVVSDVFGLTNNFTLEETGRIARNLNILARNATLNGKVSRNVNINTTNIVFPENFEEPIIGGNLNYWSSAEINIPEGVVSGETKYTSTATKQTTENIISSAISTVVTGLVLSFAIIMLSLWIAPEFKNRLGIMIKTHSIKSFFIGLLIAFAVIVGSIFLLLFTAGFGGTIAICLLGLLLIAYAVSGTIFAMGIAKLITDKLKLTQKTPFVLFSLLIVLIVSLLKFIPTIGGVINILTSLVGLGMLGMNFYKRKNLYEETEN